MKIYYSAILMLLSLSVYGQDDLYWFSDDLEKTFVQDSTKDKSWRSQMAATYYSISGNYRSGLVNWDKMFGREMKLSKADSLRYSKLTPENAKDYILSRAGDEKIIIINEAHHNASHRTFASSLLQGLYDKGYRYIGIETLSDKASFGTGKFATQESGVYSQEPEFGNFIYHALKIGFKLFPYDARGNGKEREIGEAQNIYNFMQDNKEGKYLIYCGYQHAYEGVHPSWEKTMAARLSDMTSINPFTIDQTRFSEKSDPKYNEPLIRIVNRKEPVILKDESGTVYNGEDQKLYTDVRIIHPVTRYIKGRPGWMLDVGRKFYKIPKSKITRSPLLVLAYRKGEFEKKGIPADVIELKNTKDPRFLILDKGTYDIIIRNREYKVISRFEKTID
ncbi:MAG: hypothetical protein LBE92_02355 [Chryseobacterium sp.]|jgi:hypothetical protein|uniref:hypothetical protein n=1 Tax=Chryseobacterium sp. TaxID=1871047 RepID=UPI00283245DD|nr:hypothetical protein [Chryseobacterium sp.]MDR2234942.1 hypothetical protein [Chryseobacterium sp.]